MTGLSSGSVKPCTPAVFIVCVSVAFAAQKVRVCVSLQVAAMVSSPAESPDVVKVAWPLLTPTVPSGLPSPGEGDTSVGVAAGEVTAAVKVTAWPSTCGQAPVGADSDGVVGTGPD